jgi:hypothetical protein
MIPAENSFSISKASSMETLDAWRVTFSISRKHHGCWL